MQMEGGRGLIIVCRVRLAKDAEKKRARRFFSEFPLNMRGKR